MTALEPTPPNTGAASASRPSVPYSWVTLPAKLRIARAALALAGAALLLVARILTPDPRGAGTHEQLGLPPCFTLTNLHIPCPFCGMTTAFSLMAHGRITHAFMTQPAGAIAFIAVLILVPAAAAIAIIGREPSTAQIHRRTNQALAVGAALIFLAWIYKVAATLAHV